MKHSMLKKQKSKAENILSYADFLRQTLIIVLFLFF